MSRGSIAGVVAVSAVVNHLRIWEAALIGVLAGFIYIVLILAIHRSHVDDPAYTIATHFVMIFSNYKRVQDFLEHC